MKFFFKYRAGGKQACSPTNVLGQAPREKPVLSSWSNLTANQMYSLSNSQYKVPYYTMSSGVEKIDFNNTGTDENDGVLSKDNNICQEKERRLYVLKQLNIALCLTIGNLATGCTAGWAAPIIPNLKDPIMSPLPFLILDSEATRISSSMIIGAIVGSIISGFTANIIGRKPTLLVSTVFNFIGYAIMSIAVNVTTLVLGRMFAGVTAGAISVLNVVYLGEIASPEIRGSLIAMAGIMNVFGTLLVYSMGPYVPLKVLCYVCIGISCIHVLALCYVPESPVYHVMKGKINEARLTLHELGRTGQIEEELKLIGKDSNEALLSQTKDDRVNVSKRVRWRVERKDIRGFFLTTIVLCIQAGGGRSLVFYYASQIFRSTLSSVNPSVGLVVLGLTELCGVILTPVLVERCGRRIMLMMSLGSCCLFMVLLGTYFYFEMNNYMMIISIRWLPLVLMMLFIFSFNFGVGIVPNIFSSEMYSSKFRSMLCSFSMVAAWLVLFHTNCNFKDIPTDFTHGVFWIYAGINVMGFFFVMFVVPETRGESLSKIGYLLERRSIF